MTSGGRAPFHQFRQRLFDRASMLGTFVKMPTTQTIEILGATGFDFVIIDQEHAPLDRAATDLMVLAARASNVTPIVRVPDGSESTILSVLDCGGMGVMVPHVDSVEKARRIAAACRYKGTRGFAGLTRGSYWAGVSGTQHRRDQDAQITCIAMIEDVHAVECAEEIGGVEGIDAFFVGRGDLTSALGLEDQTSPETTALTEKIAAAARKTGKPLMILVSNKDDAAKMRKLGATAILYSSDHALLRTGALAAVKDYGPTAG
jgi:2-keto-3-deoxy-L-rhamnonate aldolase RhmA